MAVGSPQEKIIVKTSFLPLLLLAFGPGAMAQQVPGAGNQLQQLPPPAPLQPAAEPRIRIEQATEAGNAGTDATSVRVDTLAVTGATRFTPAELIAASQFRPGAQLTLAGLQAMASRITEFYRQHGYFVARAYLPPQDVTRHVVTIAVVEGAYGKVTLRNTSRRSDDVANCRKPDIVADAAHAILVRPARGFAGNFLIDEDVLREAGVDDLSRYAVQPGQPLLPDLFLD
jgi:hemolysin activation/secretion protein